MDRLKKGRAPLRTQLTRLINQVTPLTEQEEPDKETLAVKLEVLETLWMGLEAADEKVKDQLLDDDASEADIQAEVDSSEEYYEKYLTLKHKINKILHPSNSPPASVASSDFQSAAEGQRKKSYKLPKIELMKFNGDLKNWLPWWSQFRKIHEDEELDESDKFQYLSQAVESGTEPKDIVTSYPQSAENYSKAVEALKERYGRDDLQLQYYVRELLTLVISNVTNEKKLPLSSLYLKLESHLRCLTTLKLDDADPATWLYPLVESSLSSETLRAWQRSPTSSLDGRTMVPPKSRLDLLMEFIKTEVRTEQQISMAQNTFQTTNNSKGKAKRAETFKKNKHGNEEVSTASGLLSTLSVKSCIFCDKTHESDRCIKAQGMSMEDKQSICKDKKACFKCLKIGHSSGKCKTPVQCPFCSGKHYPVMCNNINKGSPKSEDVLVGEKTQTSVSHQCSKSVLLNTIRCNFIGSDGKPVTVRIVGDTGSQRSYITTNMVKLGKSEKVGEECLQNIVFGGGLAPAEKFGKYKVFLKPLQTTSSSRFIFVLLAKNELCGRIASVPEGPWMKELQEKGIQLSDVGGNSTEIEILLGNDYWPNILTGRMIKLECGLVATETTLGWTLGGRVPAVENSLANSVISLLSTPTELNQLWDLESIGVKDPIKKICEAEQEQAAVKYFLETVKQDEHGRYVVALPLNGLEESLPTNRNVAEKRLHSTTKRLLAASDKVEVNPSTGAGHGMNSGGNKWEQYNNVFTGWEQEGLITEIQDIDEGHFLPHRPVFKNSVTTPVRPVYDASCHSTGYPSLNHCLLKGPNLIELIPAIMLRFQLKEIGVSSDIRKAFQMIKVRQEDKKYQKFLWWKDSRCTTVKIYQHDRVVFGLNCSPFLLGATIHHHLSTHPDRFAATMINKFYVDNFLDSVSTHEEYLLLKEKATSIMSDAKMELREWASSSEYQLESEEVDKPLPILSVLGLNWNRKDDTLSCVIPKLELEERVTKRIILSTVAKLFDPMGYLSPTTVQPKILLQKTWAEDLGWDEPVDCQTKREFDEWCSSLKQLENVLIPRHFQIKEATELQLHVYSDASQYCYAASVFLRSKNEKEVKVQLLMAKSRLAPLQKKKTRKTDKSNIPRLELMGCLIASRLAVIVKEALRWQDIPTYYWTDSSVALAWITNDGEWGIFVFNRVKEILSTTQRSQWRHVPGTLNPADLPSRGCAPKQLMESQWWEGPLWLYKDKDEWPQSVPNFNLPEIDMERKFSSNACFLQSVLSLPQFSSYRKNVAVIAWMLRMLKRNRSSCQHLVISELRKAEIVLIRLVQAQNFTGGENSFGNLQVFRDADGLLRVKTRLLKRNDKSDFISPVLLPKDNLIVASLVRDFHLYHCHGGVNFVREKLREKYWIINSRRTVSKVIGRCVRCLRHKSRPMEVDPASLPVERISDCDPFTTTGVDLAGPLILQKKQKVWIVIYTCAVYRCIHLDLVASLSTEAFIRSLERFISTFGRPNTIFSDNGTNFVGTNNLFQKLDWTKIQKKCDVKQMQWQFNPPTAAWWGGWWERLIRSVKDLLKRMIGKCTLDFDEMRTCLAGVTATINDRPLTIVSENNDDLHPLSPSMFIRPCRVGHFTELENAEGLSERYLKMKEIQRLLQDRFRKEYLSMLTMPRSRNQKAPPRVGDVVLVGSDNRKRFEWPIGIITQLCPGSDGKIRLVKVKTARGIMERPLQRLFPLEITDPADFMGSLKNSHEDVEKPCDAEERIVKTRRGRIIKKPTKYGQWSCLL